jgi:hypothetical protein
MYIHSNNYTQHDKNNANNITHSEMCMDVADPVVVESSPTPDGVVGETVGEEVGAGVLEGVVGVLEGVVGVLEGVVGVLAGVVGVLAGVGSVGMLVKGIVGKGVGANVACEFVGKLVTGGLVCSPGYCVGARVGRGVGSPGAGVGAEVGGLVGAPGAGVGARVGVSVAG